MICVLTVPTSSLQEGPYRDTWRHDDTDKPREFVGLFEKLLDRVQAGSDLPIHVACLENGKYIILDGHISYDLYKWMGWEQLQVILHDAVKTEQQALETYIAMNYLRSEDWMRDSITLRNRLATLGLEIGPQLMTDGELAADLIRLSKVKWEEYNTVFDSGPRGGIDEEWVEWKEPKQPKAQETQQFEKAEETEVAESAPAVPSLAPAVSVADRPSKVRVAMSVPRQYWMQDQKLAWLDKAIAGNPCDLFLTPQEFVGGGSTREWCRIKGFATDDVPVTESWLLEHVGSLCRKHNVHIGFGATVNRNGVYSEDFLYFSSEGKILGHHAKIALPEQDSIFTNGASQVTPEVDYKRAVTPVEIPALGLRIGTVFCWQVFFMDIWRDYARKRINLCVHPIKFAPRAWYTKGLNSEGKPTRTGFTQHKGSVKPEDDALGWIRKLKFESEFKEIPIACTCNTWDGGEKFLALVGWVDEATHKTHLFHLPSTAETEKIVVTEFDPAMFDALPNFPFGYKPRYSSEDFKALAGKKMMRKALRIERKAQEGKLAAKLAKPTSSKDSVPGRQPVPTT
jgi:hypothetical protein